MTNFAKLAFAAAAVVLVAVVGLRFLPGIRGPGATASPTPLITPVPTPTQAPTPAATPSPTPTPSPIADPIGLLQPGTYVAHPFDHFMLEDDRGFTFTTPSANWEALQEIPGNTEGVAWNDGSGESAGVGLGFVKLHSMNRDACDWYMHAGPDIQIGPTVDDLLEALASSTNFDGGDDPYPEYVANATGLGVELTMPAPLPSGCDEDAYRIWNVYGFEFDIYAQGPSDIWRLGIFDVDGERYIVLAGYMPDTPDEVRDEMMSIFRSVRID